MTDYTGANTGANLDSAVTDVLDVVGTGLGKDFKLTNNFSYRAQDKSGSNRIIAGFDNSGTKGDILLGNTNSDALRIRGGDEGTIVEGGNLTLATGTVTSARFHASSTIEVGTFSADGSSSGVESYPGGTIYSSRTNTGGADHHRFYNPNGQIGALYTNGNQLSLKAIAGKTLGLGANDQYDSITISATEDVAITGGDLEVAAGDITATNGNIVIGTSGKGIDFSATADGAGMTSELFDDYEEGNFTPVVTDQTNDAVMVTQAGFYTKTGNRVHYNLYCTWSGKGSISGALFVSGLPYNGSGVSNNFSAAVCGLSGGLSVTAGQTVAGYKTRNDDEIKLTIWDATTGTGALQASDLAASSGSFMLSGSYEV